jgi:glycine betaine/proline transport system ATP-binding protein
MRDGRVVQTGTAAEILSEPADDYVARFVQDVDRARVLTAASIMESPRVIVSTDDEPGAVVRALRTDEAPAAFVVSPAPALRLVGTVTAAQAAAAAEGEGTVGELMRAPAVTAQPDAPLADLLAPASSSELPLPVVDEDGRLAGVVRPVRLLAALGGRPSPAGRPKRVRGAGRGAAARDAVREAAVKDAASEAAVKDAAREAAARDAARGTAAREEAASA